MKKRTMKAAAILVISTFSGCLPYLYHEREPALVEGIDIDQSLKVARDELKKGGGFSVLTVWALRDQKVDKKQAEAISELYLYHIDNIDDNQTRHQKFGVWHFTWAIANLYRFGDSEVKSALQSAYDDATGRIKTIGRSFAEKHVLGEEMYTGFAHVGGRAYARKHLIVPGDDDFLQSYRQYVDDNK